MEHWYDHWNTIVIAINFCNGRKMIWPLMFIISNHHGAKRLSNILLLEPWKDMFKVISVTMAQWYHLRNRIVIAIKFCNGKKIISALMFTSAIIKE